MIFIILCRYKYLKYIHNITCKECHNTWIFQHCPLSLNIYNRGPLLCKDNLMLVTYYGRIFFPCVLNGVTDQPSQPSGITPQRVFECLGQKIHMVYCLSIQVNRFCSFRGSNTHRDTYRFSFNSADTVLSRDAAV